MMTKGPESAPITIVEFADFQCPACRAGHSVVARVVQEYGDQVRFVFRDFPLNIHPRAFHASEAAYCAGEQDKFWEYHDSLMIFDGDLSDDDLRKRASEIGIDESTFAECFDSKRHNDLVTESYEKGMAIGVQSTPTFFINGRIMVGARYEGFKQIIEQELYMQGA